MGKIFKYIWLGIVYAPQVLAAIAKIKDGVENIIGEKESKKEEGK